MRATTLGKIFGVLVAAGLMFWLLVSLFDDTPNRATRPAAVSSTAAGQSADSTTSSSVPSSGTLPGDGPAATAPNTSVANAGLANQLKRQVEPVIKLYAGYPNREGKNVALAKLRPLVAPSLIQELEQQRWAGDEGVTDVNYTVPKVSFVNVRYASGTTNRIIVDAIATRVADFPLSASETYQQPISVGLELRSGKWVVVAIAEVYESGD